MVTQSYGLGHKREIQAATCTPRTLWLSPGLCNANLCDHTGSTSESPSCLSLVTLPALLSRHPLLDLLMTTLAIEVNPGRLPNQLSTILCTVWLMLFFVLLL